MLRLVLALALFAPASAFYNLRWISDYQAGDWATDAAEHVAYEPVQKRAFIASAGTSGLQVVDLSDPVNMQQISTIPVASVASMFCAEESCFYPDLDFGGASAPCGYAPVVGMVFDKGDCSQCNRAMIAAAASTGSGPAITAVCAASDCPYTTIPAHNSGDMTVDARAATPEGCQAICLETTGCEFYSWENEWWTQGNTALYGALDPAIGAHRMNKCTLKGGYTSRTRAAAGFLATADCESYVPWEAHKVQSPRGAYCERITQQQCAALPPAYEPVWTPNTGSGVSGGSCMHNGARGSDLACLATNGYPRSSDWGAGAISRPYGVAPGAHYSHVYDSQWVGGSGAARCGNFRAGSVQSVAITSVTNYTDAIVAVAMPHHFEFANGMVAFFNARTLDYLACAPAGNTPEGIASYTGVNGTYISIINEGSAMALASTPLDAMGSMTMCYPMLDANETSGISVTCSTYPIEKANFATGAWKHAAEFRNDNVRLYGPNGNNVTLDLEPEGGTFTDDGKYLLVTLQDNDAYAMWDVEAGKYLFMKGFGGAPLSADTSDVDNSISIKSTWGADNTVGANKTRMPDEVASFQLGDFYYFITANEGGSRGAADGLLGTSGEFEGEEIRMGKLSCTATPSSLGLAGACDDTQLGRLLTVAYQPSDYAVNSCGNNLCTADGLDSGMDDVHSGFIPRVKGAGAHKCIYKDADYGGCGSICNLNTDHGDWSDPSGCTAYPTVIAHYVNDASDNAYYGAGCTAPNCDTRGFQYVSHAGGCSYPAGCTGVRPILSEDADSPNPLGYDSAVECQSLCDATEGCDYFYSEFEMGKYECFLKSKFANDTCHEFSYKDDHYSYSTPFAAGTTGASPYVSEGFASWGGPKTTSCPVHKYSNSPAAVPAGPGSPGGSTTVGGRSFSIWKWRANETELTEVFDSGNIMEVVQSSAASDLCSGCAVANANNAHGDPCNTHCPFNSGVVPPMMDDRSDDKGPEPECVTTGTLEDGTRLAFIGLERTGGIMVYDVTDPAAPVFNDFLNVRNWMTAPEDRALFTDATGTALSDQLRGAVYKEKALNDGPESLAFIDAASSPVAGVPMLLAVSPLSGRLTAYEVVSSLTMRANDGSCPTTAGCPYLPTTAGGTGEFVSEKKVGGMSTYDPTAQGMPAWAWGLVVGLGVGAIIVVMLAVYLCRREREGKPIFRQTPPTYVPVRKRCFNALRRCFIKACAPKPKTSTDDDDDEV